MAQKKITDLSLRSNVDGTCILPADDATQTWRITMAQVKTWLLPMANIGELIYGGASGAQTALAAGVVHRFLKSNGAAAPSWAIPSGLQGYVGTDPEVGGASPFQLTVSHSRTQIINPVAAITLKLPSTGVEAGEIYTIKNRGTFLVTIQTSTAADIYALNKGSVRLCALQAVPTTLAHWDLIDVDDEISGTIGANGTYTGGGTYKVVRSGKIVTISVNSALTHASTNAAATAAAFLPTKFIPTYGVSNVTSWDSSILELCSVDTTGAFSTSYKDWTGANFAQTASKPSITLSWVV